MTDLQQPELRDLRDYLAVLRRRRWLIMAIVLVALAGATASTLLQSPLYRSSNRVLVRTAPTLEGGGQTVAPQSIGNEVTFATSADVLARLAEAAGYGPDSAVRADGNVLVFSAVNTDPVEAARVANLYAEVFIAARLERQLNDYLTSSAVVSQRLVEAEAELDALTKEYLDDRARIDPADTAAIDLLTTEYAAARGPLDSKRRRFLDVLDNLALASDFAAAGGADIINPATVPSSPFAPNLARTLATSFAVALIAAIGLAFLLDYFDDTMKTKDDFERVTGGLPTLAVIPRLPDWKKAEETHIVSLEAPRSAAAEAYRSLRTAVTFLATDSTIRTVQVTSPRMRDGKTTTSTNLAVAIGNSGTHNALLIDADLRKPRLHRFFDLDNTVGLTTALLGEAEIDEVIQHDERVPGLDIITAGPGRVAINTELLSSSNFRELIAEVSGRYDLVVVDTPPVMSVADPLIVAQVVDAVVVVASAGNTSARQMTAALETLAGVGANLIGTVFNNFDAKAAGYYGYGYYGYGYGYGYGYSNAAAYGYGFSADDDTSKVEDAFELEEPKRRRFSRR